MVRFPIPRGVEECAVRIVVFTFYNTNITTKNGQ